MSGYRRLQEDRRRGERRRDDAGTAGLTWFLGLLALAFLAWAIATTIIAANRVDPPGTFQCGAATVVDGDLCYDYIIVGGGTAGLAAAKKISDDSRVSVLVLEEGPDYVAWDPNVLLLGYALDYFTLPSRFPNRYYFSSLSQPEPGLDNINEHIAGGRTLGGGSSENFLGQYRHADSWWNEFDATVGSPGRFDADSIHDVFQSIEWLEDYGHYATTPTRGFGQLPSQRWKLQTFPTNNVIGYDGELFTNVMAQAFGIPAYFNESYNNPGFELGAFAYSELLLNFNETSPQERWSGRFAFMDSTIIDQTTYTGVPPRQLQLLLNTTVTRLLSVPTPASGPRFVGAKFTRSDGTCGIAYARQGVIMSAGIHDTGIMQRSGVGPASVLQAAQIPPVLINENIGTNAKSQPYWAFPLFWPNVTAVDPDGNGQVTVGQTFLQDVSPAGVPGRRGYNTLTVGVAPTIAVLNLQQARTRSLGSWTVNSGDPNQLENIVTNVLTDPDDLVSAREEIRFVIGSLVATDSTIFPLNIDNTTLYDDTLLDAWLRANGLIYYQYGSQCRMGTSASTSAVDNRFRVWGTADNSLRICDYSAFALESDSSPSYPVAAMGTICGSMVLEDAGLAVPPPTAKKSTTTTKTRRISNKRHKGANQHQRAMSDATLWQAYQNAIAAINLKYSGDRAMQMITAMKQTTDYMRLCAIYCPQ